MQSSEPEQSTVTAAPDAPRQVTERPADRDRTDQELVESDLLVEDVSIDGMCGVY